MNVDALLRDALNDDHLDLPVPAGLLDDVRHRRRRRRAGAALAAGVAAASLTSVVLLSMGSPSATLSTFASGGVPVDSPVPGISPDFIPQSGRDWLLTRDELAAFNWTHTVPEQALFGDAGSVPSPAPITPETDELRAYALSAGLPAGCTFTTDEAYNGDRRVSVLHITLPNGTPVWLQRQRLAKPIDTSPNDTVTTGIEEIPQTTSAIASYEDFHFGFGRRWNATGSAHGVNVVTIRGIQWSWIAPHPVPLATLKTWAATAAQQES